MGETGRIRLRYEIVLFFVTTILLTWLLWLPAFLIQNRGVPMRLPYSFFITVGTFAPSAAGFFFTYMFGGKADVRLLVHSLLNMRIDIKRLLSVFLALPVVSAVSCLVLYLSGGTLPPMQFPPWFIPIAFVYILVFMGPLGEEAGSSVLILL